MALALRLGQLLLLLHAALTLAIPQHRKLQADMEPLEGDTPLPETSRVRRQTVDPSTPVQETCDFGTNEDVVLCRWMNVNFTTLKWRASRGENAFWLGGPPQDVTYGDKFGGYALFETSEEADSTRGPVPFESAMLISPLQGVTRAEGVCVKYWYAIDGLSADRVRVLLHPMPNAKFVRPHTGTTNVNPDLATNPSTNPSTGTNTNTNIPTGTQQQCVNPQNPNNFFSMLDMLRDYDGSGDVVLWEARDVTQGQWKEGQLVYTYNLPHAIIVEGIPVPNGDLNRRFRGYIAIDDLNFALPSECGAFCTFEAGTCGWVQDKETDDFDWSQSRGSMSQATGPPRDRSASENGGMTGGFAVIDSSYPRRPGDRARLMTEEFQATDPNSPLCMRFWTHMHGVGIGTLRVLIINTQDRKARTIWQISGEAGKIWYQGQVPIASATPFKIAFEAEVGLSDLGDIALDDISIIQGPCPSAPQIAGNNLGDCTFEVDECGWINPGVRDRLDEIDWVRTIASENREPKTDHTIGTPQGFFMIVPKTSSLRGGDRAWLRSLTMNGSTIASCISFWYYISDPTNEPSAPSLGSLSVFVWSEDPKTGNVIFQSVWSLMNHQGPNWLYAQARVLSETSYAIIFEGAWGNSRGNGFIGIDDITIYSGDCSTLPPKATVMVGDCDFQRDSCRWVNTTTDPDFRWSYASIARRPTSILDHTFGGPLGYVFFDVFNQNANPQSLRLTSPVLRGQTVCFSFWYAAFGSGSTTSLKVLQVLPDSTDSITGETLWKLEVLAGLQARPEWKFAQVPIPASNDFRITFEGMASNGGFAIDDIKIYKDTCLIRPREANPLYKPGDENHIPGTRNADVPT
ncbi:MAM and LDL-receptor class A domain-containing protein 2 isoform X2 [Hyalella azteca]|uniref:MAM and LDL-receptor class A domain-containing protein 2 isoform X2 n=1 Tax=Hyalella azteca TaxID=294128 RepID=A0A979FSV8_HYAAZ|nr:MAM and LDL-receptor class A domain-containing protein 2 isoform X2 [Hyalella azteca]